MGSCSLLLFCGLLMPTRSLGEVGRSVTELAEVELLLSCGLRMPARSLGEVGSLRHRAGGGVVAAVLRPLADSLSCVSAHSVTELTEAESAAAAS